MNADREQNNRVSSAIIGCAFRVGQTLGHGFLEKVYENALCHELEWAALSFVQQERFDVRYNGVVVGEFVADLIVEDCVLVEVKATEELRKAYKAQVLNYLKATDLTLGLLLNFGRPKVEVNRIVNAF